MDCRCNSDVNSRRKWINLELRPCMNPWQHIWTNSNTILENHRRILWINFWRNTWRIRWYTPRRNRCRNEKETFYEKLLNEILKELDDNFMEDSKEKILEEFLKKYILKYPDEFLRNLWIILLKPFKNHARNSGASLENKNSGDFP